jgi:hypothetical protein
MGMGERSQRVTNGDQIEHFLITRALLVAI